MQHKVSGVFCPIGFSFIPSRFIKISYKKQVLLTTAGILCNFLQFLSPKGHVDSGVAYLEGDVKLSYMSGQIQGNICVLSSSPIKMCRQVAKL